MAAPVTDLLTVDQLAERTGVSVRTIRFYAGRGLLPAPQLRGRTGLYGPGHVARLSLVCELSALGFTLAAIEAQLRRLPVDAGADELALHRALLTPWVPEQVEELSVDELARRAGRTLTPSELEALEGLGVITGLPGAPSGCTGPRCSAKGSRCSNRGCPRRPGGARTPSSSGTPPRSPRT